MPSCMFSVHVVYCASDFCTRERDLVIMADELTAGQLTNDAIEQFVRDELAKMHPETYVPDGEGKEVNVQVRKVEIREVDKFLILGSFPAIAPRR